MLEIIYLSVQFYYSMYIQTVFQNLIQSISKTAPCTSKENCNKIQKQKIAIIVVTLLKYFIPTKGKFSFKLYFK